MALVEKRECDVFGTMKGVITHRVHIEASRCEEDGYVTLIDETVDLSPLAAARLLRWVQRGTTPPKAQKAKETS